MPEHFTPTGHLAHLRITDSEHQHDARYGKDAAQRTEIANCFELAQTDLASAGKHIRKQALRYPDNPIFRNYLGKWHEFRGEREEAIAVLEQTVAQFPEYLFAIVSMATMRTMQDRPEEVLEFLGPSLRIEDRFPDRKVFHINEVEAWENACVQYLLKLDDCEGALKRVQALRSVSDDKAWMDELETMITMGLIVKRHAAEQKELQRMPKMVFDVQPASPHAGRELRLHHPALHALMERSMNISPELVQELLALPRGTLVQDLRAIVQYSIDDFHRTKQMADEGELFTEELSFVLHALLLLGELPGADSLEVVLQVFSQSSEYLDLHLGDGLTEYAWEPIAKMAEGHWDQLSVFMRTPRLHPYAKAVVSDGVNQAGQHRPDLMPQVEAWYQEQLSFFRAARWEDEVMDATQIGLMVGDILDLGLKNLLPEIEELFHLGMVPSSISGDLEKVRQLFNEPRSGHHNRPLLSIAERYAELAAIEERMADDPYGEDDDEIEDGLDDAPLVRLPIVRPAPKVGRNDPCPCGSGRKYKKCCANEQVPA